MSSGNLFLMGLTLFIQGLGQLWICSQIGND